MRVTNQMMSSQSVGNVSQSLDRLYKLQNQASTGKRITKASDDPAGTGQALGIRANIASTDQYLKNAAEAKSQLKQVDASLGNVSKAMQNAKLVGLQGANDTQTTDQRQTLANQVQLQIDSITSEMNTTHLNRYVFGGHQTTDAPITADSASPNGYTYKGDDGESKAQLSDTTDVATSVTAKKVLNMDGALDPSTPDTLTVLKGLKDALLSGDHEAIQKSLGQVDVTSQNVISLRGQMGGKAQQVEINTDRLTDTQLSLNDQLSGVENVDITDTIMQLQAEQNVYQASLIATSKVSSQSLADYIR